MTMYDDWRLVPVGAWRAVQRVTRHPRTHWQSLHQKKSLYFLSFIKYKCWRCPPWTWQRPWCNVMIHLFFLLTFLYFVKANGIFFVQVVRNPRPAVYVASQFVRKLSVDGHHQRQRPVVIICLGMLSLFHTIDYHFFTLMSRPWHGSGNSIRTFFFQQQRPWCDDPFIFLTNFIL